MQVYSSIRLCLHVIPLSIISNLGAQFTSRLRRSLQKGLGTKVKLTTAFHSQMDVQGENNIQTLEFIHRSLIIDFKVNWDKHLGWIFLQ